MNKTIGAAPRVDALTQCTFVILLAVPWLYLPTLGPSPQILQWIISLAVLAAFVLRAVHAYWSREQLCQHVAAAWVLAAVVSTLMAIVQYVGGSEHFYPWVSATQVGEAYGNLRQRNQFATLTTIGLVALLFFWRQQRDTDNGTLPAHPGLQVASLLLAALLGIGNFVSSSRTGALQLLLLLVVVWQWDRQRGTKVGGSVPLLAAVLAYVLSSLMLPPLIGLDPSSSGLLGRLHQAGNACSSRMVLWSNVVDLISLKPLTGWGWGELAFAHFTTLYPGHRFCEILGNAHNLPLHLAVELGVPFSVVFCMLLGWFVWRNKPWKEPSPERQMAWAVLGAVGVHSLLEYPLWYGPFSLAALLSIWMLMAPRGQPSAQHTHPYVKRAGSAMALSSLLVCALLAWDYWRISQIYLPPSQRAEIYRDDTLEKTSDSLFFQRQVKFAALGITPLTAENAAQMHALALEMLHFSPEASVVQKLIESARLMGRTDEVEYFKKRFQIAFPSDYAAWCKNCD